MCDPSNVNSLLYAIKQAMKRYPHLRFAQLLDWIISQNGGDIYYMKDEELAEKFKELSEKKA